MPFVDGTEVLSNHQQIIQVRGNMGDISVHPGRKSERADGLRELWSSLLVKGGVANGKHFRFVMTTWLFSKNETSLFAPLQVFDSSFDFS